MKLFNRKKTVVSNQKADDKHLPSGTFWKYKLQIIFSVIFIASAVHLARNSMLDLKDDRTLKQQQAALQEDMRLATESEEKKEVPSSSAIQLEKDKVVLSSTPKPEKELIPSSTPNLEEELVPSGTPALVMLPEYKVLYEQNDDFVGWLTIEDTVIDYPVMQCMEDENYYLSRNFYREENRNGCLILDNDSNAGIGRIEQAYRNGSKPSTNLIIHGHTMKTGQMFGNLQLYANEEYGLEHNTICFDSLYEKREYELIAVFYSQVYYQSEEVFKYYKFFEAHTQEQFDAWYNNIMELSLYDTGVTAEFGDEFITLSCCAYHVEDGRFVVVGKRIL